MSWHTLKSLNACTKTWGLKKKIVGKDFKVIFEMLLRRCGRFVNHLVFNGRLFFSNDVEVDNQIIKLITNECQNLKDIEISCKIIKDRNDFEVIKPIFSKFTKLGIKIDKCDVKDEDLRDLFASNKKLKCLEIFADAKSTITADVLYLLPCETIKTLKLHYLQSTQLQICSVSIDFVIIFVIIF